MGQGGLTLALLPLLAIPVLFPLYLLGFLFAFLEALRKVAAGTLLADLLPKEARARARGSWGPSIPLPTPFPIWPEVSSSPSPFGWEGSGGEGQAPLGGGLAGKGGFVVPEWGPW